LNITHCLNLSTKKQKYLHTFRAYFMQIQIGTLLEIFEHYLEKKHFVKTRQPLYLPIEYMMQSKAKRLRPLLCLMAYQLSGGKIEEVLPAAAAVEYFHNFTLMHDDIMDNAYLRRNEPTVFKKFGINAAILSGDLMLIQAYRYFEQLPAQVFQSSIKIFNQAAVDVCEGQQLDMDFETQTEVTEQAYIEMISKKTAALIAASLQIGAVIGKLNAQEVQRLFQFGLHLGISFQLLDDILDVYGNTQKFGKKKAGDIVQNKKTYLLIKALELANRTDKQVMIEWMNKNNFDEDEKIACFIKIYDKLDIEKLSRTKAAEYHQKAFSYLQAVEVPQEKKQHLKQYAQYLLNRMV